MAASQDPEVPDVSDAPADLTTVMVDGWSPPVCLTFGLAGVDMAGGPAVKMLGVHVRVSGR